MSIPDAKYYNSFNLLPQIGPVRFGKLRAHFPTLRDAWEADFREFLAAGIEEKIAAKITEGKKGIDPDAEWEKLAKERIRLITQADEEYPRELLW